VLRARQPSFGSDWARSKDVTPLNVPDHRLGGFIMNSRLKVDLRGIDNLTRYSSNVGFYVSSRSSTGNVAER
jgi:hypothetical protein